MMLLYVFKICRLNLLRDVSSTVMKTEWLLRRPLSMGYLTILRRNEFYSPPYLGENDKYENRLLYKLEKDDVLKSTSGFLRRRQLRVQ